MDLDGIRVDHAGLDRAADDLTTAVNRIDARLDRLASELDPLRHGWAGQARAAYDQAKVAWDTAIAEMRQLLSETAVTVAQSNADYRAADARGASSFRF